MHGKQHGRNMLICEYIWIAWKQQTLPPGAPAPPQYTMQEVSPCQCKPPKKPHRDDEQCWIRVKHDWYRERKQVSSHIQVIKNFFRFHPACESCLPPPQLSCRCVIISLTLRDATCVASSHWGPGGGGGVGREGGAKFPASWKCPCGHLEPIEVSWLGTRQKCCAQWRSPAFSLG
jgi:hypothetical protein